jgi:peptidoglycan biosynthesis protein MviN/MurJ (putative lipid II flippase)
MNLLKALATVSGMTLVSRVLGFVRDTVIARAFGAGVATDAFFVAFKIPNLLRRLFAEGAFAQAFVPILVRALLAVNILQMTTTLSLQKIKMVILFAQKWRNTLKKAD